MLNGETPLNGKTLGRPRRFFKRARCILVTGFGPFPGVPFNASEHLLGELGHIALRVIPKPRIVTAALPTDWRRASASLQELVAEAKPDIALHLGVSSRATGFVIETRAYNQASARPDCSGALAPARCLKRGATAAAQTTLPAARLVQLLRMRGLPAQTSRDPGRYLCNAVLFESLTCAAGWGVTYSGFVHIPALEQPNHEAAPSAGFGWPELRRGAAVILETLARLSL